jgi:hypothetical protein
MYLLNYEPKLVWMMDIHNNTAKQLALTLDYPDIVMLLDRFLESQPYLNLRKLYRFQIKEIKNAERRRAKYGALMKNVDKLNQSEYEKKQNGGAEAYYTEIDFGGHKRASSVSSGSRKPTAATNKIVLNENVTLLTYNSTRNT